MKLFYYIDEVGNFGDDLNPWLWDRLLPNFFDDNDEELFVGIGTLLNDKLPSVSKKHIFGSGAGYGVAPIVDESWVIHALRGPKTAEALGADASKVITDSAILIADAVEHINKENGDVGFMPHYASCRLADWENIAEACDMRFISPEWSVDQVLAELKQCRVLYTEAMHGAIVSDALRLPWYPLILDDHVNQTKWHDWLATVGVEYKPTRITSIFNAERNLSTEMRLKNSTKRVLRSFGMGANWHQPPPRKSTHKQRSLACEQLSGVVKRNQVFLSEDSRRDNLLLRYNEVLKTLRGA